MNTGRIPTVTQASDESMRHKNQNAVPSWKNTTMVAGIVCVRMSTTSVTSRSRRFRMSPLWYVFLLCHSLNDEQNDFGNDERAEPQAGG